VSRTSWYLSIATAFAIHNAEEGAAAARLLSFMQAGAPVFLRDFYSGMQVNDLRISLAILTAAGVGVTLFSVLRSKAAGSAFAMLVFAAVIGVNALAHIALAIAAGTYMPGLITALVLTLPLSVVIAVRGKRERWVPSVAYWSVIPLALLVHGPVLAGFIRFSVGIARALSRNVA